MGPRRRQLKHQGAEAAQFRVRAALGFAIVLLTLGGLGGWYFKLQVLDHGDYAMRSEANRIKPRPVLPGRGLILDRKGRVLADNVPAYRLDVTPLEAGATKAWLPALRRIVALDRLCRLGGRWGLGGEGRRTRESEAQKQGAEESIHAEFSNARRARFDRR